LCQALAAMAPQWIAYLMSFLTLGIFWAGQQTQLNHIREGSRDLTWIHLGFLFWVTLVPLTTRLLAEFITYRTGAAALLAQHPAAGRDALLELDVCDASRSDQRRYGA
jgi:uncharacterized membrane protein